MHHTQLTLEVRPSPSLKGGDSLVTKTKCLGNSAILLMQTFLGKCVKVVTLWKGWQKVTFNNLGSSWVADWLNHRPWCVNPGSLPFLDHVPQDSAIGKTPQDCFIFITRDDMWITEIHCEDRAGMSQELQEQTAILGQIPDLYLDFWSAEKNDMQFLLKSSPFPFLKSM